MVIGQSLNGVGGGVLVFLRSTLGQEAIEFQGAPIMGVGGPAE